MIECNHRWTQWGPVGKATDAQGREVLRITVRCSRCGKTQTQDAPKQN